jgi:hypothetical protein
MSERRKPVVLKPRHKVKDDYLSPSSIELWDLMYLETCVVAEAKWEADWSFCPVCYCEVSEFGERKHRPRKSIEQ